MKTSYTINELAERWNCHRNTVKKLIEEKKIEAFYIGNKYRIKKEEIEKYEGGLNGIKGN